MAFGSELVFTAVLNIETDPAGNDNYHMVKVPRAATILGARIVSENAIAAGTGITITLANWGTAGTAVKSGGTIASAIGTGINADVPTAATIVAAQARVAEGEWLVAQLVEVGGGWQATDRVMYQVDYVLGH